MKRIAIEAKSVQHAPAGKGSFGTGAHSAHRSLLPSIQELARTSGRAQGSIAKAFLDDPEQVITQSIHDLARCCEVSTGSIVQFCKSLGYKGFPALKISLARELAEPVLPSLNKDRKQKGAMAIMQRVFEGHVENLYQTLRLNAPGVLESAARVLSHARRIVFFCIGQSYPVAYSLGVRLSIIGLPVSIDADSHTQLIAAVGMNPGEVAVGISLSGRTSETVECIQSAKARGARTIAITNSVDSALARLADIRLFAAPSEMKYFQASLASRATQMALVDALLLIVGRLRGRKALAQLARAEEHLLKRRLVTPPDRRQRRRPGPRS